MLSGKNEASFDISVTVDTGEPIWRPLKRMRDKGDDFEIKVTYNYCYVDIEPEEPEEPDEPIGESYKGMGYGLGRDWFGAI